MEEPTKDVGEGESGTDVKPSKGTCTGGTGKGPASEGRESTKEVGEPGECREGCGRPGEAASEVGEADRENGEPAEKETGAEAARGIGRSEESRGSEGDA